MSKQGSCSKMYCKGCLVLAGGAKASITVLSGLFSSSGVILV